jgi:hypothetical protein
MSSYLNLTEAKPEGIRNRAPDVTLQVDSKFRPQACGFP